MLYIYLNLTSQKTVTTSFKNPCIWLCMVPSINPVNSLPFSPGYIVMIATQDPLTSQDAFHQHLPGHAKFFLFYLEFALEFGMEWLWIVVNHHYLAALPMYSSLIFLPSIFFPLQPVSIFSPTRCFTPAQSSMLA